MLSAADRIAGLSKEKQALLLRRLHERTATVDRTIKKRAEFSPCRASFAQERLWFLAQMQPEDASYNMAGVLQLSGNLNIPLLAQALNEVVLRHEALRTSFAGIQGEVCQIIAPHREIVIKQVDLTHLRVQAKMEVLKELECLEARRAFDLETQPLIRATLIKLDGDHHVLLMSLHHIVADEWSLRLLIKEVGIHYQAFKNGSPSTQAVLPIQYADFAVWQRDRLQGEQALKQLAYWRENLKGLPDALNLPTDHPRPAVMSYRGGNHSFKLSPETSAGLIQLGRKADATLFCVMMAAFNVLLFRYSGQDDIGIGYPIANRNQREIEDLIGFFVNTLVLRCDLSGNPNFMELLKRVRKNNLDAQNHQDLPFERLVEALKPKRELNRTPLFQAMLVYQNAPLDSLSLSELNFKVSEAEMNAAKFDLTLNVFKSEKEIQLCFNYSADLFEEASIVRMADHFRQLLQAVIAEPQTPVSELSLLTQAERRQVLFDWNQTGEAYPQAYIHRLFETQAENTPEAVALIFEDRSLSYAELNSKANQLAHHLISKGVGPDCLVGVCMDRSLEMVIALMGILKAGGAYLPLDPAYPQERLDFMLNDIEPSMVLTQAGLLEKMSGVSTEVLCLDSQWEQVSHYTCMNPQVELSPLNLAYCIYTSGSTGQPKGAAIPHQGILNRLQWMQQQYPLNQSDRVLQKTPYSFDVSVWEFFWPLMTGAGLAIARPDEHKDPLALIETVRRERITTIHFVPSMLHAFLESPGVESCRSLKRVICSGEALNADLARRFHQKSPAELHNLYGPTEASVDVSYWPCLPESVETYIGRPIANIGLYILDSQLNPVPIGVPGELYIAGIGLGRGYINRPGLTAERFIPNPYGQAGSLMYKTGDLVKFLSDGNIAYLGRIDHQVKIRGFRIELGEIEARLLEIEGVKEAVVVAREGRLIAYWVGDASLNALKERLKAHLPDYMVPGLFVQLEAMPLSSNGKLDRKRLPEPDWNAGSIEQYQQPQPGVEAALAEIWLQLLGADSIGRHDNFFELGGDSILSIQAVSRARQAGIMITPKHLFQHQTIAELATVAEQHEESRAQQGLVEGFIPLTPAQHWFFEQDFENPHHWNQALFLTLKTGLKPGILDQAFRQLLIQHDALRMRFNRHGASTAYSGSQAPAWEPESSAGRFPHPGPLPKGEVDSRRSLRDFHGWQQTNLAHEPQNIFECIDLSHLSGYRQTDALEAVASARQSCLNLTEGPLMRAVWFDLGEHRQSRLLIVIHHLVVDGVSWRILLEDLSQACSQLMSGQAIALPAKTASFKDWSNLISEGLSSGYLAFDPAYWMEIQGHALPLPVDQPMGGNLSGLEEAVWVCLSEAETRSLLQDVPAAYRTQIDDILLTALVLALRDWTHGESFLIDLEGHGREEILADLGVSRTVGFFTAIYPVLLNLAYGCSLDFALKSVKEQLRAVPDKGIAYGWLRYGSADPSAIASKAQILFNYMGQIDKAAIADELFSLALEKTGENCDPSSPRSHELAVVSSISEGCLRLGFYYSRERYRRSTLEGLAGHYAEHIRALTAHCAKPGAGGYTPSDFPLIELNQAQLDGMALKPRQVESVYPLAPLQHGLMFHGLYAPESSVYCIQLACRLRGELNVQAFKQAWQYLTDRHAVLRTRFYFQDDGNPLQIVDRQAVLPIDEYDWRGLSEDEKALKWQKTLNKDQAQGFDFKVSPLMRLKLARCSEREYYFLWTYHHILLDGWSSPLLIKDVFEAYQSLCRGKQPCLQPAKPYGDYIVWLKNQDMAEAESYWKEALAGFDSPASLGSDQPKKHVDRGKQAWVFTAEKTQKLHHFARQHQITLNTLLQGAWGLLLSRYSGSEDVLFGITVSGRPSDLIEVENRVGLFINTLPMRLKISPEIKACEWLKELFAQNQSMRRYEYMPLQQIQKGLALSEGLFESLLVFENYPIDQALSEASPCLAVEVLSVFDQTHYPLTVSAFPGSEFRLELAYDASRFEAETVCCMAKHLDSLLNALSEKPGARLCELPMLSREEYRQVVHEWNQTGEAYPQGYIHRLFEVQAENTPEAVALIFEDRSLSYAELNSKANRLAHHLISKGVGPDCLVGVCMDRCLEMVIALMGILKAGGAYLPLDPAYPQERLDFMLNDIEPSMVLTQAGLLEKMSGVDAEVLCLDSQWEQVSHYTCMNPQVELSPLNLAYCIYTSGSTGQPKGTGIPHQGILNRLQWMQRQYPLNQSDRILQKTPYSFDVSVWEFFWPLMTGAGLVIARPEEHKDPLALIETVRRERITTIHFVPSMLHAFLESPGVESCRSLKRVICSGEALNADLARRFHQKSPAELHNLYGPTEASVDVSYWPCLPESVETYIGRPIANIGLYILDSQLNPVPIGVPGELYIAGIGLGRGYINRPGLTAERFIPNPYGQAGSLMYQTGDLVRFCSDGNIAYLGRIDHQVKIRGFRIELGEIEARLLEIEGLKEAVVVAREGRLLAYWVGDAASDTLKEHLKAHLPDYMVPGFWVQLEAMPLSSNGKLDRKRLPEPEFGEELKNIEPRTATEKILAGIWSDLLGLEKVGIADDFFDLGGHSLLATQLAARVCKHFEIELPLRTFVDSARIAELAVKIDLLVWAKNQDSMRPASAEAEFEEIAF